MLSTLAKIIVIYFLVHTVCDLVWSYYVQMMGYWEIIVTKPYLASKEAQLYSLSNGAKSSSILFGELLYYLINLEKITNYEEI